jgi:hypothetical protein
MRDSIVHGEGRADIEFAFTFRGPLQLTFRTSCDQYAPPLLEPQSTVTAA